MQLLSVGALIDGSWDRYRDHYKTWLKITAWFLIPSAVFAFGVLLAPAGSIEALVQLRGISGIERAGIFIRDIGTQIVLLFIAAWVTLQVIKALQLMEKGGFDIKSMRHYAFQRSGGLIVLTLLRYLLIGLPSALILPGFGLTLLGISIENGLVSLLGLPLTFIGIILAIVGVIYMGVQVSLAPTAFVLEEQTIIGSLKRSRELIKGRFWAILFRLLLPKLVFTMGAVVISIILLIVTSILFTIIPFTSEAFLVKSADAASDLIAVVPFALIAPLLASVDYLLFKNVAK